MASNDSSEKTVMDYLKYYPQGDFDGLCRYAKSLNGGNLAEGQKEALESLFEFHQKASQDEQRVRTRRVANYIGQTFFADAVLHQGRVKFVKVYSNGKAPEFCETIHSDDGKEYMPISQDDDSRLLKLPKLESLQHSEDPMTLFRVVKTAVNEVWDAGSDTNLNLFTLWIFATYGFDLVGVAPYLRLRGPYGSGKTRGLDVIGHLALRPLPIGPSLTEAVVFRLCELYKPSACLNEFDEKGHGDYSSLAVQLLNSRYERGHPIGRIGGQNNDKLQLFDPFGPTAFSARVPFSDSSLESRCLEILCAETEREDIPAIISPEEFEILFAPLRNRLYLALRIRQHKHASKKMPDEDAMPRRFRQLLTALWHALPDALLPELEHLILQLRADEKLRLSNSDEGETWLAIFERAELCAEKEEKFELTGAWVGELVGKDAKSAAMVGGKRLAAMGFEKIGKLHGVRLWGCSEKLWLKMAKRLGIQAPLFPWAHNDSDEDTTGGTSSDVKGTSDTTLEDYQDNTEQKSLTPPNTSVPSAPSDDTKCPTSAQYVNSTKVLFLKDHAGWVGACKQTYGPFKAGESSYLPTTEAAWAIKAGFATLTEED